MKLPFLSFLLLVIARPTFAAIEISPVVGRTWHDFDFDGDFNDGVSSPTASSLIAHTTLGASASRAELEFDLASLGNSRIQSAMLRLSFFIARDLNVILPDAPYLGPPTVELYGYQGNGIEESSDVLATSSLIATFNPQPLANLDLDVTTFLQTAMASNYGFAGFMLRIAGDDDPTQYAEAWFGSQYAGDSEPRLRAETVVPEGASVIIWLGLVFSVSAARWKKSHAATTEEPPFGCSLITTRPSPTSMK